VVDGGIRVRYDEFIGMGGHRVRGHRCDHPAAGSLLALTSAAVSLRRGGSARACKRARQDVGRVILLGPEIPIIADIVLTIMVERTLRSTPVLGVPGSSWKLWSGRPHMSGGEEEPCCVQVFA
jgi:hypothetical protein